MAEVKIVLEKQLLTIQNQEIMASGSVDYDRCAFAFDGAWSGYVKTAVFYQDRDKVKFAVLDGDDACMIPADAMAREGNMYVGVFGVSGSKVLTSTVGRIYIRQGALSGEGVSTEPSDDIFLAIIAQYQRILELMREYEDAAERVDATMEKQNALLETLNAFDVKDVQSRLDLIEDRMTSYANTAKEIMGREVVLRDVPIKFVDGVCRIESEVVTESSLCDVYFDEFSYEAAAKALILPVSHDGYMEITSSISIQETLNANILVRRS